MASDRHDEDGGQGDLFDDARLPRIKAATVTKPAGEEITTDDMFQAFHDANPHVYVAFVRMARRAKSAGRNRIGMQMLAETLRWDYTVNTNRPEDDFKINNNYLSRYARRIMEREEDLAGIFETRRLRP